MILIFVGAIAGVALVSVATIRLAILRAAASRAAAAPTPPFTFPPSAEFDQRIEPATDVAPTPSFTFPPIADASPPNPVSLAPALLRPSAAREGVVAGGGGPAVKSRDVGRKESSRRGFTRAAQKDR